MSEILWTDSKANRAIRRSSSPPPETLRLLDTAVWGSRAIRYRILGIEEKLRRLREPNYFVLSEGGKDVSVVVLDFCTKKVGGVWCDGFHFVMAATRPDRQDEGLAGILISKVRHYCVDSLSKNGFGFAYVEETTEFSLRLSDHIGHCVDARLPIQLFTRLFPRSDPRVEQVDAEDLSEIVDDLNRLYADHELSDFETSVHAGPCYTIKRGDSVIAAVQPELLTWSVVSMPSAFGWFLLNVASRTTRVSRFLDLRNLRIVRFSNLLLTDGNEAALFALLEDCLRRHGSRIGLILMDERSPVLQRIRARGDFGRLSKAVSDSVRLRLDTVGMTTEMIDRLKTRPLLMSAADVF